jgi:hypothetical protein
MGKYGKIWVDMGHYGYLLVNISKYGKIWIEWVNMGKYE